MVQLFLWYAVSRQGWRGGDGDGDGGDIKLFE